MTCTIDASIQKGPVALARFAAENLRKAATCFAALLVDGHVALYASGPNLPAAAGVTAQDDLDTFAATGKVPTGQSAAAPGGTGAGVLLFNLTLPVSASPLPL